MKVWKISDGASSFYSKKLGTYEDNAGDVDCHEVGDHFTLAVIDMSEEKYKNLPEWDGW